MGEESRENSGRTVHAAAIACWLAGAAVVASCGVGSPDSADPQPVVVMNEAGTGTTATAVRDSWASNTNLDAMDADGLAKVAVTGIASERNQARLKLRAMGAAGMQALEAAWAMDVDCLRTVGSLDADEALEMMLAFHETVEPFKWESKELSKHATNNPRLHRQQLEEAFAVVTAQHDGLYSGVYWETDLDKAREASRSTGKPIVSLRVLGRLDDAMC